MASPRQAAYHSIVQPYVRGAARVPVLAPGHCATARLCPLLPEDLITATMSTKRALSA